MLSLPFQQAKLQWQITFQQESNPASAIYQIFRYTDAALIKFLGLSFYSFLAQLLLAQVYHSECANNE
jgi:hypothetical protein